LYVSAGDDRSRILGSAEKRRTGEPSSPSLVTEVPSGKKPRLKEALPRKQGQAVGELLECLLWLWSSGPSYSTEKRWKTT